MDIKPIRNEADYQDALQELERLWGADPGTPDGDKLDVLATLIDAYEEATEPIEPPDPVEALLHYIERQNLEPVALVPYIGSEERVIAILERREPLTLEMIRSLRQGLDISADVLIQPYDLEVA
jgi:HTH-type transcriptional regulator/antitoxin HigA